MFYFMPELPEMENYRVLLTDKVIGKQIEQVIVNRKKSINVSIEQFQKKVVGYKITKIKRRAKHLLFILDSGLTLVLHLMLGGVLFFRKEMDKPNRSTQIEFVFGEERLFFIGLRLGYLHLLEQKDLAEKLISLGPEPLESSFTVQVLTKLLKSRRSILKSLLVNQSFISGIGNCYSDEICFETGILPMRKGNELSLEEIEKLHFSMQQVLTQATIYGGYMDMPLYVNDILTGGYDDRCKVYDRGNEPCLRCGESIIQDKISSRKVFYCSHCQL
jgi:formamidopyrimidine-DNA glycosylase